MIQFKQNVEGLFRVKIARADGSIRWDSGTQHNLVTQLGFNNMLNGTSLVNWGQYLSVGSGTNPPAESDVSLQSRVATVVRVPTTGWTYGGTVVSPYYTWHRFEFIFATGAAAGILSELGITNSTGAQAWTRALIRDSGGTPTSITVLPDEQLIVTYEIRFHTVVTDIVTTQTVRGVPTTITIRPRRLGQVTTSLNTSAGANPSNSVNLFRDGASPGVSAATGVGALGTAVSTGNGTAAQSFTPGNKYNDAVVTIGPALAKNMSITGINLNGLNEYAIGFSPGIAKGEVDTLSFSLRMTYGNMA